MFIVFRLLALLICLTGFSATAFASDVVSSIADMEKKGGFKARYQLHPGTQVVRFFAAEEGRALFVKPASDASAEASARAFLGKHGNMFGVSGDNELTTRRVTSDEQGNTFVRLQQHQGGLPVIAGEMVIHADKDNNVKSVFSRTTPKQVPDTAPRISSEKALTVALAATAKRHKIAGADLVASTPELSIYDPALLDFKAAGKAMLVWKIEVTPTRRLSPIRQLVLVDANSGRIALTFNQAPHAKNRVVYDKNNIVGSQTLPGTAAELKRSEGNSATGIIDVDKAYDYAGDTYDFYLTNHGRDSIDGLGMQLVNTVRYCDPVEPCPFQNAYWDGDNSQMVYGDGFTQSEDVVGHELTHGVTERTSGLYYYMQSGAINESFSDVWGEFIQQTYTPPTPAKKWLIGEDLPGGAGRSMKDPPAYGWTDTGGIFHPDPDKMTSSNYACGDDDQGGVHTNSGINNKAAFLMTEGGSFNGKSITGLGITKVAKIYYYAQTNLLTSGSDYVDLYNALQLACTNLATTGTSGITSVNCLQVKNAVDAVEMSLQPTSCAAPEAPICDSGSPVNLFYDDLESSSANWIMSDTAVWDWGSGYAKSGINSIYGMDTGGDTIPAPSDTNISMATPVTIPANAFLYFDHAYDFQYDGTAYDGGVVEYSANGGANGSTWSDAGALFTHNGYNKTLHSGSGNILGGRRAFGGLSNGYISSRLNLATLSGTNTKFRFRIATDNYTGSMGWMIDNVRIYTCTTGATVPGAPIIGTATAGNALAIVTFTAPASSGGSQITGYTVTSSPGSITATGFSSPITVTGLTNGINYTFTVKANNANGSSPASAVSNSVTPSGGVTSLGAAVDNTSLNWTTGGSSNWLSETNITHDGVDAAQSGAIGDSLLTWLQTVVTGSGSGSFWWKVSSEAGFDYLRFYIDDTVQTGIAGISGEVGWTQVSYSIPTTGTHTLKWQYSKDGSVMSGSDAGWVDQVVWTPGGSATVPDAPTIGTATAGNASASVTFSAPASDGGSAISGYTVTSSPGNIAANGSSSPITVTGLTNGASYTFTVKANNAIGSSLASAASNSVTPVLGATVPGAPTIGTATAGNASATVTFTAPANNGGSVITGYTVTSDPGNFTATGTASPITVTGLANSTAYTFTVKATNSAGSSTPSAPSNIVTPVAIINNYTVTPGTATNVTMTPATPQTVAQGATSFFTIVPDTGYGAIVAGCGGTFVGTTYTTGPITRDCSLTVSSIRRSGTNGTTPSLSDAVNAFKAVNSLATLTPEDKIRYDVAPLGAGGTPVGDGVVDIADVILILRRSIGIFSW